MITSPPYGDVVLTTLEDGRELRAAKGDNGWYFQRWGETPQYLNGEKLPKVVGWEKVEPSERFIRWRDSIQN